MLDHGGEAAGGRRHRPGREVLALGVAGILEVGVGIDRARQHDAAGGVDDLVGPVKRRSAAAQRGDASVNDEEIGVELPVIGGDRAARDQYRPAGRVDRGAHRPILTYRRTTVSAAGASVARRPRRKRNAGPST